MNDDVETRASTSLEAGDTVEVRGELPSSGGHIKAVNLKLKPLYEDDACWVLNKPAGIAVHPGHSMDAEEVTLLHGIKYLCEKEKIPFSADAVLVHRLDRETTGCILVAKNAKAHQQLQKQFETRTVRKLYLALIAGVPSLQQAIIDSPIGRSRTDRTKMSVQGISGAREAKTTYRIVDASHDVALVECDLHTGRTHQVRVHLQSIGHPVLGDVSYKSNLSESLTAQLQVENLCLHAWKLTFVSPDDKKEHDIIAPLPVTLTKALKNAGIQAPKK